MCFCLIELWVVALCHNVCIQIPASLCKQHYRKNNSNTKTSQAKIECALFHWTTDVAHLLLVTHENRKIEIWWNPQMHESTSYKLLWFLVMNIKYWLSCFVIWCVCVCFAYVLLCVCPACVCVIVNGPFFPLSPGLKASDNQGKIRGSGRFPSKLSGSHCCKMWHCSDIRKDAQQCCWHTIVCFNAVAGTSSSAFFVD